MVICLRCALTGQLIPLHVETWFVRVHRQHHINRYWICPICKLQGHRVLI